MGTGTADSAEPVPISPYGVQNRGKNAPGRSPPFMPRQKASDIMATNKETSMPNIVLIMADQLSASALGCYGHPVVKTPHLDALAADGVTFQSCYCNSPLCTPSRASFFTGRLVSQIGAFDNGCELPASVPTFVHHLRNAGYKTVLSGKAHFIGPDQLHGFEERLTTDIYPASQAWTPDWSAGVPVNPGSNLEQVKYSGVCKWNLQLDYDEEALFRAREFLRAEARELERGDQRPFFLNVSFTHPHEPFVTTQEWWDLYADEDIPMPEHFPAEVTHPFNRWLQIHQGIEHYALTAREVRAARHAYYAMCSYLDSLVGQLVAELEYLGLRDNTAIVFMSDHGEMLGEHGMWFKRTFFDSSSRVPLIFSWPGGIRGPLVVKEVVSLVDVFPTLCEISGAGESISLQSPIDGNSLWGLLNGNDEHWKNEAVLEYCAEGVLQPMRMVRSGDYKYVVVNECEPLLFNMANDPNEIRNLSGLSAVSSIEAALRARACAGFDMDDMRSRILRSQRDRAFLNRAMAQGRRTSWDWTPPLNAADQYVRRNAQEETTDKRYPFVRPM